MAVPTITAQPFAWELKLNQGGVSSVGVSSLETCEQLVYGDNDDDDSIFAKKLYFVSFYFSLDVM